MNDNDTANDVTTEYKAEALRIGEEEGVEVMIVVQSHRIISSLSPSLSLGGIILRIPFALHHHGSSATLRAG